MIPKILHTIWLDKHCPFNMQIYKNIEKFKFFFGDYTLKMWTYEAFIQEFDILYVKDAYKYGYIASAIEVMKIFILNKYKGIWLDSNIDIKSDLSKFIFDIDFMVKDHTYFFGIQENSDILLNLCDILIETKFINNNESINITDPKSIILNNIKIERLISDKIVCENLTRNTNYSNGRCLSIIIPFTNFGDKVNDYITSLLNNSNDAKWYDIIIGDVNSHDNTYKEIQKIKYNNVIVLDKKYNTVGDFYNDALNKTTSDIILFINQDVALINDFKNIIYMEFFSKSSDVVLFNNKYTSFNSLYDIVNYKGVYNCMAISKDVKYKLNYWFEPYYENIESYKFCINAYLNNCTIKTSNIQITLNTINPIEDSYINKMNKVFFSNNLNAELTAVIVFINENTEVERTVSSLRYKANNIKVLLIDDNSSDEYDYENIAKLYNCKYIKNSKRIGSAGSKHLGGMLVDTPYLCFFDAHMRVYKDDWDVYGVDLLKKNPKSIIASRSTYMSFADNTGFVTNEAGKEGGGYEGLSACCKLVMDDGKLFEPKWVNTFKDTDINHELSPVTCVLGATYLVSKDWWEYIQGLKGLHIYGLEESYMSIKTWLLGGECFVTKHWGVGHIYRNNNPAPVTSDDIDTNRYFLIKLFYDGDELEEKVKEFRNYVGKERFINILNLYKEHDNDMKQVKQFIKEHQEVSLEDFLEYINVNLD